MATKLAASKAENAENKAVVDQTPQSKIVESDRARGKFLLREICDHIEDVAPRELVEDIAIANDNLLEAANMLTAQEGHADYNRIDSLLVMGTIARETIEQAHDHSQRLISRIRTQFHILVVRKNKWFSIVRIIASNEGLRDFTEEEDEIIEAECAIYEGDDLDKTDDEEGEIYNGEEETYDGEGDDDGETSSEKSVLTRLCGSAVQNDINSEGWLIGLVSRIEGIRDFTEEKDRITEVERAIYEGDESGVKDDEKKRHTYWGNGWWWRKW